MGLVCPRNEIFVTTLPIILNLFPPAVSTVLIEDGLNFLNDIPFERKSDAAFPEIHDIEAPESKSAPI